MSLQLRLEADESLAYTKVGSVPAVVLVHGISRRFFSRPLSRTRSIMLDITE